MNLDRLNGLPEWNDEDEMENLGEEGDGEAWKPNPTRDACKALYKKWDEIMMMLYGALATDEEAGEDEDGETPYLKERKALLFGDAFQVGVKIRSSETGNMYILRMENAAIIRKNAQFVKISMHGLRIDGLIDEAYVKIIRDEIDVFRGLFKHWVATFTKDEFEDEWGLFV